MRFIWTLALLLSIAAAQAAPGIAFPTATMEDHLYQPNLRRFASEPLSQVPLALLRSPGSTPKFKPELGFFCKFENHVARWIGIPVDLGLTRPNR